MNVVTFPNYNKLYRHNVIVPWFMAVQILLLRNERGTQTLWKQIIYSVYVFPV